MNSVENLEHADYEHILAWDELVQLNPFNDDAGAVCWRITRIYDDLYVELRDIGE